MTTNAADKEVSAEADDGHGMLRRVAVWGAVGFVAGVVLGSLADYLGVFRDTPFMAGLAGGFFGAGLVALLVALRQATDVGRLSERVRQLEDEDGLTGLPNAQVLRQYLEDHLAAGA